jgi:hypothetical protein
MARWLVTKNDAQFAVGGLAELREMARTGRLSAGDMIQPPGATDWLYATEIPELQDAFGNRGGGGDDDILEGSSGNRGTLLVALVALLIAVAGGYYMYDASSRLPDVNRRLLGEGGLSFSEMIVTSEGTRLLKEPVADGEAITMVNNSAVLVLLSKRHDFYRARVKDSGAEGWVAARDVMPMYLVAGGDVTKEYDPLYNPDRYTFVQNASWMQLPEQQSERVTVFQFMIRNDSQYDVTDLVMVATIKDAKGHELEKVEFTVGGIVPATESTTVGTLAPEGEEPRLLTDATFQAMATMQPDLALSYNEGVEVSMKTDEFTEATIDIVELRAIPNENGGP